MIDNIGGISSTGNIGFKNVVREDSQNLQKKFEDLRKKDDSNLVPEKKQEPTLEKVLDKKDKQTVAEKTAEFVAKVKEKQQQIRENAEKKEEDGKSADEAVGNIIDTRA